MYSSQFYITDPVGNNAFSFEKRTHKKLFVTSLKEAESLSDIALGNEIVFEDIDENEILQSCKGLKNFYLFHIKVQERDIPLYLFDNHNHALFFWYREMYNGVIKTQENTVLHIDEHADTRIPTSLISPLIRGDVGKTEGLQTIFHYTNFIANVGDYMIPAQREDLIGNIHQVRSESSLERDYDVDILNLDLDFFSPHLDYIPYAKKRDFILKHIKKAKLVTVCTSPFFISQHLALEVFRDIFAEFIHK